MDHITFKWGTLTAWSVNDPANLEKCKESFDRWASEGVSMSAACQHSTEDQKKALCDLIDAFDGEIWNDWEGTKMSKEVAKDYVTSYGRS